MSIPLSFKAASLPRNLVLPFGIVCLCSNQKSKISPTRKISFASFSIEDNQRIILSSFSLVSL
jgi:hypothetical protein|tara:strand:+ start:783 stop:971 length:189 start_codon:yes stop_codon:yes gene_type:complete